MMFHQRRFIPWDCPVGTWELETFNQDHTLVIVLKADTSQVRWGVTKQCHCWRWNVIEKIYVLSFWLPGYRVKCQRTLSTIHRKQRRSDKVPGPFDCPTESQERAVFTLERDPNCGVWRYLDLDLSTDPNLTGGLDLMSSFEPTTEKGLSHEIFILIGGALAPRGGEMGPVSEFGPSSWLR